MPFLGIEFFFSISSSSFCSRLPRAASCLAFLVIMLLIFGGLFHHLMSFLIIRLRLLLFGGCVAGVFSDDYALGGVVPVLG